MTESTATTARPTAGLKVVLVTSSALLIVGAPLIVLTTVDADATSGCAESPDPHMVWSTRSRHTSNQIRHPDFGAPFSGRPVYKSVVKPRKSGHLRRCVFSTACGESQR